MVMLEIATSSMCAPSTLSIAMPRESSKTQFVIAMFLKSPLDSVPSLIRPVRYDWYSGALRLNVASSRVPSSKFPAR